MTRSAVVIIDVQEFQVDRSLAPHSVEQVISNSNRLIEAGRSADALVVYVQSSRLESGGDALRVVADNRPGTHGAEEPGWDRLAQGLFSPRADREPVTIKRGWDAFYGSSLELQLRRHGVNQIVLTGISTNFGVEGTARSAVDRGFAVTFAEDAMTSASAELHNFAVSNIFPRIGRTCSTTDAVALLSQLPTVVDNTPAPV